MEGPGMLGADDARIRGGRRRRLAIPYGIDELAIDRVGGDRLLVVEEEEAGLAARVPPQGDRWAPGLTAVGRLTHQDRAVGLEAGVEGSAQADHEGSAVVAEGDPGIGASLEVAAVGRRSAGTFGKGRLLGGLCPGLAAVGRVGGEQ